MIVEILVLQHEVPAVVAVLAAVRDDVADLPQVVLGRRREQETSAAAVDARDLWRRSRHPLSLPTAEAYPAAMRVIAGDLGGRRLVAPEGTDTRPTTDRVREAISNALASAGLIEGAVVADLFAGSGALGIEALSRGAARCVFVENDRRALSALEENLETLGLSDRSRVVRGDAVAAARSVDIDIAFADPPYDFSRWQELADAVTAEVLVAESGQSLGELSGWSAWREKRYSRTWVTFLDRATADDGRA